jgi:ribosomal protein S18 acetylase RimI-like enzyme
MSEILSSYIIRKAQDTDREFILEAIIAAEAGGKGPLPWCALFNLSEAEYQFILGAILDEEIEGQEWCLSQFYIAAYNGKSVAALSAWEEGREGQQSSMLMSTLVYHFITEEKRLAAQEKMKVYSQIRIDRTPHALQLESIYTHPEFRGRGIAAHLIQSVIQEFQHEFPEIKKAEIMLSGSNVSARRAYEKIGFSVDTEINYSGPPEEIQQLFPGNSRIKLSKNI